MKLTAAARLPLLCLPLLGLGACRVVPNRYAEKAPSLTASDREEADKLYGRIFAIWSEGNQPRAEALLEKAVEDFPAHQRLSFFRAACVRSRFDIEAAAPLLRAVRTMDRQTPEGKAAYRLLQIDAGSGHDADYLELRKIVRESGDDPILLWMQAVACRTLKNNDEGVDCYERLLKKVAKGSALVHQTFANMLDEIERHSEALEHRKLAVELEPADWSEQGMEATKEFLREDARAKESYDRASKGRMFGYSEAERRAIFAAENRLAERLTKTNGEGYSFRNDRSYVSFLRGRKLTTDQMMAIYAEGVYKKW